MYELNRTMILVYPHLHSPIIYSYRNSSISLTPQLGAVRILWRAPDMFFGLNFVVNKAVSWLESSAVIHCLGKCGWAFLSKSFEEASSEANPFTSRGKGLLIVNLCDNESGAKTSTLLNCRAESFSSSYLSRSRGLSFRKFFRFSPAAQQFRTLIPLWFQQNPSKTILPLCNWCILGVPKFPA